MNAKQFQTALITATKSNFLIKLVQMEAATALLKSEGPAEGAESILRKLEQEAKRAFEIQEDAISVEFLRTLCKNRNLKVDCDKITLAKRLLRNANYYKKQRQADKIGCRKRREKWTEEETEAFLQGYKKYGHSKWVQIQEFSPKLKKKTNKQIRAKARNLIMSGDLDEMYKK